MKYIKSACVAVAFLGVFIGGLSFERFVLGKHTQAQETSVALQIKSTQSLAPKAYGAHFIFEGSQGLLKSPSLSPEQEKTIKESFKEINDLAQEDHLCQQAIYNLRPRYTFGPKQELSGYSLQGAMDCKIPADKLKAYNTLKDKISQIALKSGLILPSTPALYPQIKEIDWSTLRQDLIKKAQEQTNWMGKQLKKQCHIQHLDFYPGSTPTRLKAQQAPASQDFVLIARLKIGC
ncbi:hypothetical protein NHP190002_02530 [Helicobacter ailurogastricus]|uniref:hypothetical protein n=1 Tax=Helicobacter ailurogastricus TaxID=1578720 RepID=UPI00244D9293|nr:hypothetical protein [Helicobacter ailurogastricus]GMB89575.1 hypothetical protein NHP190002_02530 [Helicobacter ailurogastricus]